MIVLPDGTRRAAQDPNERMGPLAYRRTAAGLSGKSWPSRMYVRTIRSLRCPARAMMLRSLAPAIALAVARPARRLCPA